MTEAKDSSADLVRRWHSRSLTEEEILAVSDLLENDSELRAAFATERYAAAVAAAVDRELEEARATSHLATDELERWVDGRETADAERVRAHLALCDRCRAEVEDLSAFAAELRREPERSRVRRWSLAAAAGLLLALGLFLGQRSRPGSVERPASAPAAPAAPAASTIRTAPVLRDGSIELRVVDGAVSGVPESWRSEIEALLRHPELTLPAAALAIARGRELQRGAAEAAGDTIQLVSPVSEIVVEDRPAFRWRGPAGAKYRIEVYGPRFARLAASGDLSSTEWRPPTSLPSRELLTWTVAVTGADGASAVYPLAPAPPAVFEVAGRDEVQAVAEARATGSHLLTGLALWRAGLVADAARELDRLVRENPDSALAQGLAASSARGAELLRAGAVR